MLLSNQTTTAAVFGTSHRSTRAGPRHSWQRQRPKRQNPAPPTPLTLSASSPTHATQQRNSRPNSASASTPLAPNSQPSICLLSVESVLSPKETTDEKTVRESVTARHALLSIPRKTIGVLDPNRGLGAARGGVLYPVPQILAYAPSTIKSPLPTTDLAAELCRTAAELRVDIARTVEESWYLCEKTRREREIAQSLRRSVS